VLLIDDFNIAFFHIALSFTDCYSGTSTTNVESYSVATRLCILLWRRDDARQFSVWNPCNLSGKLLVVVVLALL
jgi:hypothetical protein